MFYIHKGCLSQGLTKLWRLTQPAGKDSWLLNAIACSLHIYIKNWGVREMGDLGKILTFVIFKNKQKFKEIPIF